MKSVNFGILVGFAGLTAAGMAFTQNAAAQTAYANGRALPAASGFGVDDVIDPADTRRWIMAALRSVPAPSSRTEKKLKWIDAW